MSHLIQWEIGDSVKESDIVEDEDMVESIWKESPVVTRRSPDFDRLSSNVAGPTHPTGSKWLAKYRGKKFSSHRYRLQ